MRANNRIAIPFLSLLAAGCVSLERPRIPIAHGVLGAYSVQQESLREVWIDGQMRGFCRELHFEDIDGIRYCYREVEDAWHQALGYVDAKGRAYRYDVFGDPRHVTTDDLQGAILCLFELDQGEVRIVAAQESAVSRPRQAAK